VLAVVGNDWFPLSSLCAASASSTAGLPQRQTTLVRRNLLHFSGDDQDVAVFQQLTSWPLLFGKATRRAILLDLDDRLVVVIGNVDIDLRQDGHRAE
jgi:hypothetical protein